MKYYNKCISKCKCISVFITALLNMPIFSIHISHIFCIIGRLLTVFKI